MHILVRFLNSITREELGEFWLKSFMPCHAYTRYRLGSKDYVPYGVERIAFENDDEVIVQTIEVVEEGT